ncbi:AraC family transcriptional regulator [Jeotgalibacillus sp. S-D1]|uniref:helix-turn-helix transcriptional regulator n=1 Tax=Jeotgalibacillus sp. S-D1 TaxID=2552189 RepID=UPI001059E19A|nr:AraC family transcriptional regulator [Jeotgalibacillus sp. S-D1]TDL31990.1 AraC family transcriptional regulator [Jeotgalibacillus sp. S-D1]
MLYTEQERIVQHTIKFIENQLHQKLTASILAKQAGYSKFHFHRIFQKITGTSIAGYIRNRRLTQAARELISTDQRVIDIALKYHFGSQESFTRAFTKIYHMTPLQYRKLLRKLNEKGEINIMKQNQAPEGWIMTGDSPQNYETGIDQKIVHSGNRAAFLKSKNGNEPGFSTLMQQIKADHYKGERIQFSAFVKTQNVQTAGLWVRVDHSSGEVLAFDNMMNRPISGTNDWNHFSVVLDVPSKSDVIAFGILLSGEGQLWIDGCSFKIVDESVPVTETKTNEMLAEEPVNLNFEQ